MKSDRERYRRLNARRRSIEVECIAEVDIEEFETEVLVDELRRRSVPVPGDFREDAIAAYEALRLGRNEEAELILERLLWPKWKSVSECGGQYEEMRLPE